MDGFLQCKDCGSIFLQEWAALEHEAVFNHVLLYSEEELDNPVPLD